jgi:hypothetical protein
MTGLTHVVAPAKAAAPSPEGREGPERGLTLTLSNKIIRSDDIQKPPNFWAHLLLMGMGKWLKLGDADSSDGDVKAQVNNEQVNISLVAALLFTVTTSYVFAIDEFNWAHVEAKWGAQTATIFHEFQLIIAFISSVTNVLATIVSVVILMIYGELDNVEAGHFQQLMGLRQSVGFQFLMLSASLTGVMIIIHSVIFAIEGAITTAILLALFGLCAYVAVVHTMVPAMDVLYRIKFASQTSRPTTLPAAELAGHVRQYCAEFGVGVLSEQALLRYIAIARDRVQRQASPADRRASFKQRDGMTTVLSPASRLLLKTLIEGALQRYVDAKMDEVGNDMIANIQL